MQFEIYKDNGALFHWRLVADDGVSVAVSAVTFASPEEARRAAAEVHLNASSATGTES